MTTHHTPDHRPDRDDDQIRPTPDPLRPDRLRCDCGATAGRDGLCRKCRARALWERRSGGRRPRCDRPPSHPRERRARRDRRNDH